MTYRQFRRCDRGLDPWPPGHEEAIFEVFDPLTSAHSPNTLADVNPAPSSNALRSQAQISDETKAHKFVQALIRRGLTYADVADYLEQKLGRKFPRSTVQSWAKPKNDPSRRGIPTDAAMVLRDWLKVPLSAWQRVIPA